MENGRYVAGGGSPGIEVALRLKEYAASLQGREQLAVYKIQAINSATGSAAMMLRIGDVIAAGNEKLPEKPPLNT